MLNESNCRRLPPCRVAWKGCHNLANQLWISVIQRLHAAGDRPGQRPFNWMQISRSNSY